MTHAESRSGARAFSNSASTDSNVISDVAALERLWVQFWTRRDSENRNKLVVNYNSLDELEGILGHIQ